MKLFTVRIIKVGCTTSIGEQRKTFTVDENGKQNSPSFDSFNDFCEWKNEVRLYDVRYDLTMTAKNYPNALNNRPYAK